MFPSATLTSRKGTIILFYSHTLSKKSKTDSKSPKDTMHERGRKVPSDLEEYWTLGAEGTISSATEQASVVERL